MSRLDAFFGRIQAAGVDLALGFGINFGSGLRAARNPATNYIDVSVDLTAAEVTSDLVSDASAAGGPTVEASFDALVAADTALAAADTALGVAVAEVAETVDRQHIFEIYDDFEYAACTNYPAVPPTISTSEDLVHTAKGNWAAVSNGGSGIIRQIAGVDNHPGVFQLETQATANRITRFYGAGPGWVGAAAGAQQGPIRCDNIDFVQCIARNPINTSGGFLISMADGILRTNSIEFSLDTNTSALLQCNTIVGSVQTQTLVALPTAATWVRYEIHVTVTSVQFLIDGVVVATHAIATAPATVALNPYIYVLSRSAAIRQFDLDLFWLRSKPLTR